MNKAIYQHLIAVARAGDITNYGVIAPMAGLDMGLDRDRVEIGRILGAISADEHEAGRPILSAIVVHQDDGRPGQGFFSLAKQLGLLRPGLEGDAFWQAEVGRVHDYWRVAQDAEIECSPSSLLGYAADIHALSGAVCAYCGFGRGSSQTPGCTDFDLWRQLTLEHVIPGRRLDEEVDNHIRKAIDRLLGLTKEDWPKKAAHNQIKFKGARVHRAVYDACEVTSCHLCNSITSRDEGCEGDFQQFRQLFAPETIKDLMANYATDQDRLTHLLLQTRAVVREAFKKRLVVLSGKLRYLAGKYNEQAESKLRKKPVDYHSFGGLQEELWDKWPAAEIAQKSLAGKTSYQ